ncbi:glutamate racemase [candidate division WOR-3 bacterium]|nr:glutamate racemase [candidate division WOR-3 bacterium]MCK4527712.1 glutamate racemase [candidate division WOR-3 bacterium]
MQKSTYNPIGIFDSGIGGLTVVREIRKSLPDVSIIYFGDTARVPYGTKSKDTIIRFAQEDINFLLQHKVSVIVSACFSVSSNALPSIEDDIEVPIIGMIKPGVKAIEGKSYSSIGVIGTQATIESGAFEKELKTSVGDIPIHSMTCPLFVPLAEEGWLSGKVTELVAEKYLSPLVEKGIEALILGCTHYPLLTSIIKKVVGEDIDIIEPGKEVALIIKEFLSNDEMKTNGNGSLQIYLSDIPRGFAGISRNFLGHSVEEVHLVKNLKTG